MTEQQKYPLAWPLGQPRAAARKRAQFNTGSSARTGSPSRSLTIAEATSRLHVELARMRVNVADDCVLSSNLVLNMSGFPRSGQGEPADPGVAVYWQTRDGQRRVMAIDIYDRVADNIAAVARTLEYMRGIERHGGSAVQERAFTGFAALPAPRKWWQVLAMDPPREGEGRDQLAQRIKAAHKAAMITMPRDGSGNVIGAAAINVARDEGLEVAGARR